MFIPPKHLNQPSSKESTIDSAVFLKGAHLIIRSEIAKSLFGNNFNAYMAYYPAKRMLLIASVEDELFKKLHKASQHLIKDRNLQGDKSIALHEILIDEQIDDSDRSLAYEYEPALGVLNIQL
jgi:hypothetical protein